MKQINYIILSSDMKTLEVDSIRVGTGVSLHGSSIEGYLLNSGLQSFTSLIREILEYGKDSEDEVIKRAIEIINEKYVK